MEIIFLGTSAGVPTKSRNVSATALRRQGAKPWYLVDCGEGTQQQILHTRLSLTRLEAILITHIHGDHCYGLPGLLASAAMAGRERPLVIVGPRALKAFIEAIQTTTGLYLPYPVEFFCVEELTEPVATHDFTIEPVELSHRVPSYGYVFLENRVERKLDTQKLEASGIARGPVWGRLVKGEDVRLDTGELLRSEDFLLPLRAPRKLVVSGDNDSPELLEGACAGASVLVHEATYTQDVVERLGTSNQHATAAAVAEFAQDKRLANLVLTHFSPRYQYGRGAPASIDDIKKEARRHYQGSLFLANDFDIYRLSRDGALHRAGQAR